MGRLAKSFKSLPTCNIRPKAWTRDVRSTLFKDLSHPDENVSIRVDSRIKEEIENLKNPDKTNLKVVVGAKGEQFVSESRWLDWWNGAKPSPIKIETINYLVPDSMYWFESKPCKHPVQNFLHAVDLYAQEPALDTRSTDLLAIINEQWRPRSLNSGHISSIRKIGWNLPVLPGHLIPANIVIEHYRPLEPASIIESMLWTGNELKVDTLEIFNKWVVDLVVSSLSIKTFIAASSYDMNDFESRSNDIASLVMDIFLNKNESLNQDKDKEKWISYRCNLANCGHQNGIDFVKLLLKAEEVFRNELLLYGITVNDIKSLWTSPALLDKSCI